MSRTCKHVAVRVRLFAGEHPYADMNQFAAIYKISQVLRVGVATAERARYDHLLFSNVCARCIMQGEPPPYDPALLSAEGRDFLRLCFLPEPSARPSAEQLLQHPFVRDRPAAGVGTAGTVAPAAAPVTSAQRARGFSRVGAAAAGGDGH